MSVGKNVPHDSARTHVTGESVFIDDRAEMKGEVHVGVVGSTIAHGKLLGIDFSEALSDPDTLGVYTARDFHAKKWGTIVHDQPFLVSEEIRHHGEPVALIASRTREGVERIIKKVRLTEQTLPGVFTIHEARAKGEILHRAPSPFRQGDPEAALQSAPHRLSGVVISGGQEHFYMESQAAIAYPLESGQIEVHSSSQHPSETQRVVAEALGRSFSEVVCVVKRMGGGFGGKESQAAPIAAYAALVADRLKRPARLVLTKDQDMVLTGKRHPFENEYEVGFDEAGRILSLKVLIQSDGGAYTDLSPSILERAMFHIDGAYFIPNIHVEGVCYRTHHHSHTAFRGFGGPQGTLTIEAILEDIASALKLDAHEVRSRNLYRGETQKTPYGQVFENNLLPEIESRILLSSDYENRLRRICEHNAKKAGTVKGISLTATKFGIAFTARFLNQANALVNLQLDGTVQVSTGATEMGQGVNTKIGQIVAGAFGLSMDRVRVMPTSTEKNSNTSPTAASSGSDLNGAAAFQAAELIRARLSALAKLKLSGGESTMEREFELHDPLPDPDFRFEDGLVIQVSSGKSLPLNELIQAAYQNRISLSGYAHYKTPGLGFDKVKVSGRAFGYFTQGMAVSEVTIDEYTGELKVDRVDILMDLGRSLNPGVDSGQVSGAFIQGMGWLTSEKLYYNQSRALVSHSPTTYKIPNVQDTPRDFRIDFIENDGNPGTIHGSKAVGEPPFLLGMSVWTAVKHALSFRSGGKPVSIEAPATPEVILMALERAKGRSLP